MGMITRASHADRKRYSGHIAEIYALGYIDDAEADTLRAKVLQAKEVSELRSVFSGMPAVKEKAPKSRLSPGYFVPRLLASGVLSLLLATVPHSYHDVIPVIILVLGTVLGGVGAVASAAAMLIMLGARYDKVKEKMDELTEENGRLKEDNSNRRRHR